MARDLLTMLVIILLCINASGQDHSYVDSLRNALDDQQDPQQEILTLRRLAWHLLLHDVPMAKKYTQQFRAIAVGIEDDFQVAVSDHYLGLAARLEAEYALALKHFHQARNFYETDTLYEASLTGVHYNIGVVHQIIGDMPVALSYLYKDLSYHRKVKNAGGMGNAMNSIGICYKNMKEYDRALEVYDSAYILAVEGGDRGGQSNILVNQAIILQFLNKHDQAIQKLSLAQKNDKLDGYELGIAANSEMLARSYIKLNLPDSALHYALNAMKIRRQRGSPIDIAHSHQVFAELYLKQQEWSQAEDHADSAMLLAQDRGRPADIQYAWKVLSDIYIGQSRFKEAYNAEKRVAAWTDTLYNKDKIALGKEMQARFEAAEQQENIDRLQAANATQEELLRRRTRIRNLLIALLVVLAAVAYLFYRMRDLTYYAEQLRHEKEKKEQKILIDQLYHDRQNAIYGSMLEGQENERSRIAKDLHDGLGGLLSSVRVRLDQVSADFDRTLQQTYQETKRLVDQACEEVRRISHNMMPSSLKMLGLEAALEEQIEILHPLAISTNLTIDSRTVERLDEMEQVMIYRVVQEAINNVIRHAKATQVRVRLAHDEEQVELSVSDNGVGFVMGPNSEEGIGITNMEARAQYLKGKLIIESEPGNGTRLKLIF